LLRRAVAAEPRSAFRGALTVLQSPIITTIPRRRPFLAKLRTSILKRRIRMLRWVNGHSKDPVEDSYFGATFILWPDELISEEIAIKRYEWWELSMMLKACREYRPDIFIDVGANIGLYTCVLGRSHKVPKVLAFEPDIRNFARLSENVAHNGLADIADTRAVAVGARKGRALLVPGTADNPALTNIGAAGTVPVDMVALDDALDIQGRMICVKIDVEGYELDVLSGGAKLFRSNAGYAQIEFHCENAGKVSRTMIDYGWEPIGQHDHNLVFARKIA
jgi:FkbM family methyltransferase